MEGSEVTQVNVLWEVAKREPWTERPLKSDVVAMADGMDAEEAVIAVHGLKLGTMTIAAFAVTSDALYIAQAQPGRRLKALLTSLPAECRSGSGTARIPRARISGIALSDEAVTLLVNGHGSVELKVPGRLRTGALDMTLRKAAPMAANPRAHQDSPAEDAPTEQSPPSNGSSSEGSLALPPLELPNSSDT